MLRNSFRRSADHKQRGNKEQSVEIDSAASSGGQGSTRNTLASVGLRLKQQCQYLMLAFLLKTIL
jgi:hypothetical protein